jgi:hypothetical protein
MASMLAAPAQAHKMKETHCALVGMVGMMSTVEPSALADAHISFLHTV